MINDEQFFEKTVTVEQFCEKTEREQFCEKTEQEQFYERS